MGLREPMVDLRPDVSTNGRYPYSAVGTNFGKVELTCSRHLCIAIADLLRAPSQN